MRVPLKGFAGHYVKKIAWQNSKHEHRVDEITELMAASLSRSVTPVKITQAASTSLGSRIEMNVNHRLTILRLPTVCQNVGGSLDFPKFRRERWYLSFSVFTFFYEVVVIMVVLRALANWSSMARRDQGLR